MKPLKIGTGIPNINCGYINLSIKIMTNIKGEKSFAQQNRNVQYNIKY